MMIASRRAISFYLNLYKGLILFRANANLDRFSKTTLTYIRD